MPLPGTDVASFRPDYGQSTVPAESGVAAGINSIEDANAIVEGMDGRYFLSPKGALTTNCTNLVHALMPSLPASSLWLRGDQVQGNLSLPIGTPIATFNYYDDEGTNGYGSSENPGGVSGHSHTGIYLWQDENGVMLLNQFEKSDGVITTYFPWNYYNDKPNEAGSHYYTIRKK